MEGRPMTSPLQSACSGDCYHSNMVMFPQSFSQTAAYRRWRHIGLTHQLQSDEEIACFLMKRYDESAPADHDKGRCSTCGSPLVLSCSLCDHNTTGPITTVPNTGHITITHNTITHNTPGRSRQPAVGRGKKTRRPQWSRGGRRKGQAVQGGLEKQTEQWEDTETHAAAYTRLTPLEHTQVHTQARQQPCQQQQQQLQPQQLQQQQPQQLQHQLCPQQQQQLQPQQQPHQPCPQQPHQLCPDRRTQPDWPQHYSEVQLSRSHSQGRDHCREGDLCGQRGGEGGGGDGWVSGGPSPDNSTSPHPHLPSPHSHGVEDPAQPHGVGDKYSTQPHGEEEKNSTQIHSVEDKNFTQTHNLEENYSTHTHNLEENYSTHTHNLEENYSTQTYNLEDKNSTQTHSVDDKNFTQTHNLEDNYSTQTHGVEDKNFTQPHNVEDNAQPYGVKDNYSTQTHNVEDKNFTQTHGVDDKFSLLPQQQQSSLLSEVPATDTDPSLLSEEGRPSLLSEEGRPSLLSGEGKPSLLSGEGRPEWWEERPRKGGRGQAGGKSKSKAMKEFYCGACSKQLSSRQALERHLASKLHAIALLPPDLQAKRRRRQRPLHPQQANQDKSVYYRVSDQFVCKICGQAFDSVAAVKQHRGQHKAREMCHLCGKTVNVRGFRDHMARHRGERRFACPSCPKSFINSALLKEHAIVHTADKPYCCDKCGACFRHRHTLKFHLRTHLGIKAYRCSQCDAAFTRPRGLSDHLRVHTGEKPYGCHVCRRYFASSGNLAAHRRKVHKMAPLQPNVPCRLLIN